MSNTFVLQATTDNHSHTTAKTLNLQGFDILNNTKTARYGEGLTEVTKNAPCPHCGKPDWCYSLGELTVCKRDAEPAKGWEKTSKTDKDGNYFYAPSVPKKQVRRKGKKEYIYTDRQGKPLVKVTRIDGGDGKKKLYQHHWDGKNWVKGLTDEIKPKIPIYRYQEVQQAIADGKDIRIVEGEGVADALWELGIPATTNLGGSGKWYSYGNYKEDLTGCITILCPDRDIPGVKHMLEVKEDLPYSLVSLMPPSNWIWQWQKLPKSGGLDVKDWIEDDGATSEDILGRVQNWDEVIESLNRAVGKGSPVKDYSDEKYKIPKADIISEELAEYFGDKLLWNNEHKVWRCYNQQTGLWESKDDHYVEHAIQNLLASKSIRGYGNDAYIVNIRKFLSRHLCAFEWGERQGILPFEDGVVDIATGKFEEHFPGNRLTWCLPRKYNISVVDDWGTIRAWMGEAWSDPKDREKLLCFAAAVIRKRHDLQKFLYLVGTGGSGKGTYSRLLGAIIGDRNVWSGKIEQLADKNDAARLLDKPLAIFPDQDKVTGGLQLFKNLTGGDELTGKRLYKDGFNFRYQGLSLITANAPVLLSAGSWLKRRAVVVSCNHKPSSQRDLDREFESEIAAFTRYLLSIPNERIDAVIRDNVNTIDEIDCTFWEMATRSDSIAAWVEECVIFDEQAFTQIGKNKNEWADKDYNPAVSTLFGSYHDYCRKAGLQGKAVNNFVPELEELCQKVLGKAFVERDRNVARLRGFRGIRLRREHEDRISDGLTDKPGQTRTNSDKLADKLEPLQNKDSDKLDKLLIKPNSNSNSDVGEKFLPLTHQEKTNNRKSLSGLSGENVEPLCDKDSSPGQTFEPSLSATPQPPQYKVGDRVLCYPTYELQQRNKKMRATITDIKYESGIFAGCTVKWTYKGESKQATIPGGSPDWLLER